MKVDTAPVKKIVPIVLLLFMALIQSSATAMLKYGTRLLKADSANRIYILFFALAMVLYCISFPIFAHCLSKLKLVVAQPIATGSLFLYAILFSIFLFKEKIEIYKIAGIVAIIIGIVLIAV